MRRGRRPPGMGIKIPPMTEKEAPIFKFRDAEVGPNCLLQNIPGLGEVKCNIKDLVEQGDLGRGNFGVVNLVIEPISGCQMARKRIMVDRNQTEYALREIAILMEAQSDYVTKLYGVFLAESFLHICLEYADCGSLDIIYKKTLLDTPTTIPEDVLSRISFGVVSGLIYLRKELRTVHRDIKPSNILLCSNGQVKICDFGIAGKLQQSQHNTFVGTKFYMAPERLNPKKFGQEENDKQDINNKHDIRADCWSLGLTLFELAKAKIPYKGSSDYETTLLIVDGDPPSLKSEEGFSENFIDFVNQCLIKYKVQRPYPANLLQHSWINSLNQESCTSFLRQWIDDHDLKFEIGDDGRMKNAL